MRVTLPVFWFVIIRYFDTTEKMFPRDCLLVKVVQYFSLATCHISFLLSSGLYRIAFKFLTISQLIQIALFLFP